MVSPVSSFLKHRILKHSNIPTHGSDDSCAPEIGAEGDNSVGKDNGKRVSALDLNRPSRRNDSAGEADLIHAGGDLQNFQLCRTRHRSDE